MGDWGVGGVGVGVENRNSPKNNFDNKICFETNRVTLSKRGPLENEFIC